MNLKTQRFINEYNYIQFSSFIETLGWFKDSEYNDLFSIWHVSKDESDENELTLPKIREVKNIDSTLADVLDNLACYYKKNTTDVIDQYNLTFTDKLKFQIKSNLTKDGLIPLSEGIKLIENSKELIVSSMMAARKKKKNYIGQRPDFINDIIERVDLGQTEEGSYIINLFIPNRVYSDEEFPLLGDDSFSRKSVKTIESAANTILAKIEEYEITNDMTIFDNAVESGVSSNFCYAISEMCGEGKSDLRIIIQKNNGLKNDYDSSEIVIPKEKSPIIKLIGDYYRKDLIEEDFLLKGIVTKLHQEPGQVGGEISLTAIIEDKLKRIKMMLNEVNYLTALEAHRKKLEFICRGTLIQREKITMLQDISSVALGDPI
jgi:hypothetical protein